ncbi:response regulator transcription factor [Amycolatopsis azurea]|uniref:helix-turn-helix transcriptional regulator n=1 Tax=Amycolatopsis azurea TaxID=36819 RepID=UPI00382D37A4
MAIDEVLALLQTLGDFARHARSNLTGLDPETSMPQDVPEQRSAPRNLALGDSLPDEDASPEADAETADAQRKPQLTHRQHEVLGLLTQGLSNRRIGRSLHITEQTVKAHLHMIYRKLGATDRTDAVVIAMHHGLVPRQRQQATRSIERHEPRTGARGTA